MSYADEADDLSITSASAVPSMTIALHAHGAATPSSPARINGW
jgi:hypothetical protein